LPRKVPLDQRFCLAIAGPALALGLFQLIEKLIDNLLFSSIHLLFPLLISAAPDAGAHRQLRHSRDRDSRPGRFLHREFSVPASSNSSSSPRILLASRSDRLPRAEAGPPRAPTPIYHPPRSGVVGQASLSPTGGRRAGRPGLQGCSKPVVTLVSR